MIKVFILLWAAMSALYADDAGFRSERLLEQHYRKHGHEFGNIDRTEYLRLARELRDARVGGPILEQKRAGRGFSRFDRRHGYFGAYDEDRTIRTFFIPVRGESYFRRQGQR